MKKLVCILTVLLCLCACAVPCFAENADVVFTLKAEQKPEENVAVNIFASKDSSLYTTEFYITYDKGSLEFVEDSAVPGEAVASLNPIVTAIEVVPGKIKVSYTSTKPFDQSGAICRVEFRALRTAEVPLSIEIEHAETFDGEHIRSLTTIGDGTRVSITEQPAEVSLVAIIVAVALVVGVIVAAVIVIKKKKNSKIAKKKKGKK